MGLAVCAALLLIPTVGAPADASSGSGSESARGDAEPTVWAPLLAVATSHLDARLQPRTLLVKTRQSPAKSQQELGVIAARVRPVVGHWVVVRARGDLAATRRRLLQDPAVLQVVKDRVRQFHARDPLLYRYQPYLRATMDFAPAWDRSSGSGVTVAVLDSGVDASHPDLSRVRRGRDLVGDDRLATDPNGHGTFVSGVIAADRGNHRGIAGASRATILPVRVLNARGFGRDSDIAAGIRWAVNHGADIINLSLGGPRPSRVLKSAVSYAKRHDVLVVASAGNDGGTKKSYPAAYPSVIAVGATDNADRLTWFSQRGQWVDVVAPGWHIASTVPGNKYALGSGTSFSAPLVAAAAALVVDEHPRWSHERVRALLMRSTADAGPIGPDLYTGLGVIDVDGALGGRTSVRAASGYGGRAVTPATARGLDRRSDGSLAPEGSGTWFVYRRSSLAEVTIEGSLDEAERGVLRGDLVLEVYDADLHLIRRVDRWSGARVERTTLRVASEAYVRVSSAQQTRSPGRFTLRTRANVSGGSPTTGSGLQPMVLDASPQPNETGVDTEANLTVTLGRTLSESSISSGHVQLIDGATGNTVSRSVSYDPLLGILTIDPTHALIAHRDYALVLRQLRSVQGVNLPETWIGFRVH